MKTLKLKAYTFLISGLGLTSIYGQVGINTEQPKVTLDVVGKPTNISSLDGITAPRIKGVELKAKTYTSEQKGAIVYVTEVETSPTGQTANVTNVGYYYFDGSLWQKFSGKTYTAGTGLLLNGTTFSHAAHTGDVTGTTVLTIADNAVTSAKIADGTIVGADIADGTINSTKLAPGVLTNIYNSDGTLSSNRVVTAGDNTLTVKGTSATPFIVEGNNWTPLKVVTTNAAGGGIVLQPGTAGWDNRVEMKATPAGDMHVYTNGGGDALTITKSGDAGIGTINPSAKLHVAGTTRIDNLPLGDQADQIVTADANGNLRKRAVGDVVSANSTNIYNSDGTLSSNRVVTAGDNTLTVKGTSATPFIVEGNNWTPLKVVTTNAAGGGIVLQPGTAGWDNRVEMKATPAGDMRVYTNGGGDALTITKSGDAGIGTINPSAKLHVAGTTRIDNLPLGDQADQIVTADANGNLRKRAVGDVVSANSTNIYNSDGTLSSNRVVTAGDNTLTVKGTSATPFIVEGNNWTPLKVVTTNAAGGGIVLQPGTDGWDNRVEMKATPAGDMRVYTNGGGDALAVTKTGNVGIGTNSPQAKLDVVGSVRIADGTQQAGRILTSDSNGNASWETPTMSYAYAIGKGVYDQNFPGSTIPAIPGGDRYIYTGMKITLPTKGKYAILLDLAISTVPSLGVQPLLSHNPAYTPSNNLVEGEAIVVKGTFWDEILPEGIDKDPIYGVPMKNKANSMWSGTLVFPLALQRASNTMYIENTTSGPKTFYFYGMAVILNPKSNQTKYVYELASGRWGEESLTAFKIGE
ncbi:hypothetical protein [Riemerella anatipestifer]|uniref:hypothetical protein n=1 Tax=Riemerella anatipestifer TaxID=34085 RepID=UPI001375283C|nr:hypothetical protein [Riemerella anatipestifer]